MISLSRERAIDPIVFAMGASPRGAKRRGVGEEPFHATLSRVGPGDTPACEAELPSKLRDRSWSFVTRVGAISRIVILISSFVIRHSSFVIRHSRAAVCA